MDGEQNGQEPIQEPPRVRFGPRPTQTMPLEWAEIMLTQLCERDRKRFGDLLASAAVEGRAALNGERH